MSHFKSLTSILKALRSNIILRYMVVGPDGGDGGHGGHVIFSADSKVVFTSLKVVRYLPLIC